MEIDPETNLSIYQTTITIDWVRKYLDNCLEDPLGYHKLLCMTHSDKPTASQRYQNFLYKLPSIKYTWDWESDYSKTNILARIAEEINALHNGLVL